MPSGGVHPIIIATKQITSGDELKYRNGLAGLRGRGIPLPYSPALTSPIGAVTLTVPTSALPIRGYWLLAGVCQRPELFVSSFNESRPPTFAIGLRSKFVPRNRDASVVR